jgi:hypothetical protein
MKKIEYAIDIVIVSNSAIACEVLQYMEEWFGRWAEIETIGDEKDCDFYQHTFTQKTYDPFKVLRFLEAVVIDYPECAIARIYSENKGA